MRYAFAIGLAFAVSSSVMAASTPTSEQCKSGYKAEYAKMWTKDQFTKPAQT
jgi:acyl-homoserine lactone acylase PvdQ